MTYRWLPLFTAAAIGVATVSTLAQTVAPAASAPASAPLASKPGPRLQTPTELRDSASTPGDLRPEERVTPQIVLPLRQGVPATKAPRTAARRSATASSAGIDDSVARCEAQASEEARRVCRAGLAPKGVKR